ncbi:unnamed protein product [Sphacelaria rigidula]
MCEAHWKDKKISQKLTSFAAQRRCQSGYKSRVQLFAVTWYGERGVLRRGGRVKKAKYCANRRYQSAETAGLPAGKSNSNEGQQRRIRRTQDEATQGGGKKRRETSISVNWRDHIIENRECFLEQEQQQRVYRRCTLCGVSCNKLIGEKFSRLKRTSNRAKYSNQRCLSVRPCLHWATRDIFVQVRERKHAHIVQERICEKCTAKRGGLTRLASQLTQRGARRTSKRCSKQQESQVASKMDRVTQGGELYSSNQLTILS